ncbi:MAG: efflux RND transporter permease subunit, partial [Polyangia bacterium]
QTWRSTVIPAITIPVSLVGTFIFVRAFGFSINTLTLFGLTLATGLVVDDAIVVIENVERHLEEGAKNVMLATSAAMKEVTGVVIATSLVLIAVFVPVALFPGTTGRLYVQFALTIAFSIALSAFNALTLSPALAALLLRPRTRPPWRPLAWFGRGMTRLNTLYHHALRHVLHQKWIPILVFVLGLVATFFLFKVVPSAFVPEEDQGYLIVNVQAPDGVSLDYTEKVAEKAEDILFKQPEVADVFSVVGFSFSGASASTALLFVNLRPFGDRKGTAHGAPAVVNRLRRPLSGLTDALVVPFLPPAIRGIGNFGGFQYELQDRAHGSLEGLAQATHQITSDGNRNPKLRGLFSAFTVNAPQLHVELDRDRALSLGVPIADIAAALQVYLGSLYVNDFDFNDRVYRVYIQARASDRSNPEAIKRLYVRGTASKGMIPLESLVRITPATTPQVINHYNMFRSAEVNGAAAPGASSGQALATMAELSKKLPTGMSYQWSGLALEEIEAGSKSLYLFGLGVLVVFLVLAAQYESFTLPLTILLSVPLAILGALSAQWLRGLQNDVYCQVGLVMLVGLAAKNAILIVEFAEQLRERGLTVVEAAIEAASIRLRPILMTSLAFILGVLPMVFATGAGSASRHSLGTTVLGGMVVSSLLNLFLIPVLYVIVEGLRLRLKKKPAPEEPQVTT